MYIHTLFSSLLDFLYPPLCLSCSSLLPDGTEFVCAECLGKVARVRRDHPEFGEIRDRICDDGIIDDVVAPFWFEKHTPLQAVIHALKYQHIPDAGVFLGAELGREVLRSGLPASCIIPVPLHTAKLREREYNQAERIAIGVSRVCGIPVLSNIAARSVNTRTQTELTIRERQRNVDGAFSVAESGSRPADLSNIMIVDDVVTTGATVTALAAGLVERFGSRIVVAAAALAARE